MSGIYKPITYFFRNHQSGYSIYKAISPIVENGKDNVFFAPKSQAGLNSVISNIIYGFRNRDKININHITGDVHYLVLAMCGCKTVLTIHDLVSIKNATNPIKKYLLKLLWFKLPIKYADRITCISECTRQQILDNFKVKPDKVIVVHNPIDPMFKYAQKNYNADCPRILHIGTGWNKNVIAVAKALNKIKCKLVIVGKLDDKQKQALKENNTDFENLVGLSDEQIYEEYCKCDVVSFPSLYEGFGMPIIEGMATGRVVVTSNLAPMTEIAGNAACLVNPQKISSIRDGFNKVLTDSEYRSKLVKDGLENVKRFDLAYIKSKYQQVYDSVRH